MRPATEGDAIVLHCLDVHGSVKVLTGFTVTCLVLPPGRPPGPDEYPWPGSLAVTDATHGRIELTTTAACFPVAHPTLPYYLSFRLNRAGAIVEYSRRYPIDVRDAHTGTVFF